MKRINNSQKIFLAFFFVLMIILIFLLYDRNAQNDNKDTLATPLFTKKEVKKYIPIGATKSFRQLCYDYNWEGRTLSDIPKKFTKSDPVDFAEFSEKINLDAVLVLAVPHHGYCTYDTKVGVKFPGIKGDWFGEVVKELHKRNISALGYITLGTNWKYMRDNIDKPYINAEMDSNGVLDRVDGICFNAPGYIDLVEAYSRELLTNYLLDALRYDMFFSPKDCICEGCQSWYKKLYDENFTSWEEIQQKYPKRQQLFNLQTLNRTARRIQNTCRDIKPSVEIWQNHINTDSYANINLGRDYDIAYVEFGDPFRMLALRGILNKKAIIVGQTLQSPIRRLTMALGARCYQYMPVNQETALPFEKDMDWFVNDLSPFFKMVSDIQPYLEDAELPTDIGIVFSENTRYHFEDLSREAYMKVCEDITMSYMDNSIPIDFINSLDLNTRKLEKYKLLILPRTSGLTSEELDYIRHYVKNGGNLLVTGDALLYNEAGNERGEFSLSKELGIQFENVVLDSIETSIEVNNPELKNYPLLSSEINIDGVVATKSVSGETLAHIDYKSKKIPLVHINTFGKGKVAYVASSSADKLIRQTADFLTGPMFIKVSDPEKQVVLSYQNTQNRYILHLIEDGDYSIFINNDFVNIENVEKQYPEIGWDYNIVKTKNGININVKGSAEDRLLVLTCGS